MQYAPPGAPSPSLSLSPRRGQEVERGPGSSGRTGGVRRETAPNPSARPRLSVTGTGWLAGRGAPPGPALDLPRPALRRPLLRTPPRPGHREAATPPTPALREVLHVGAGQTVLTDDRAAPGTSRRSGGGGRPLPPRIRVRDSSTGSPSLRSFGTRTVRQDGWIWQAGRRSCFHRMEDGLTPATAPPASHPWCDRPCNTPLHHNHLGARAWAD